MHTDSSVITHEVQPDSRPTTIDHLGANAAVNFDDTTTSFPRHIYVRYVIAACLIGVASGISVVLLNYAIAAVTDIFTSTWWIPCCMPLAGITTYGLYNLLHVPFSTSTSDVIDDARVSMPVRVALAPVIFIGTCLTVMCGGSAGKEGAAMQVGGGLSSALGHVVGLSERKHQEILIMAGIAAGLSAVLSAPFAAFIFAFEVMHRLSKRIIRVIIPLIASYMSWGTTQLFHVEGLIHIMSVPVDMVSISWIYLVVIGIISGVCAYLFCKALAYLRSWIAGFHKPIVALCIGGIIFAVLLMSSAVFRPFAGTGSAQMNDALAGVSMPVWGFAAKMLLTLVTLSFGFKGGEVMPTLAIGACLGAAMVTWIPTDQTSLVALTMIAYFAGVTNCPVASIALAAWLFGPSCILPMTVVCLISFFLSISTSVYRSACVLYTPQAMIKGIMACRKNKYM